MKRIPPDLAVAKNPRFTSLSTWESPISLLNLEFLATTHEQLRYLLASGP
ncbi:MAG: hypothetical protein PVG99_07345 [Desulfobacteraceae bacterium]